ncbi:hypothetical protein M407DRAFT_210729 [Tulasnella calospora MUT 4182]|uniref:Uncharacterized protein n=1 Tax=Tulasnella calospora MUT 4182 TaxID=1051891 RepID=A0A0C3KVA4_9AGAM|nr:hypothetical protein M407DRAFT_210729 [Tulasnella calospora MUT 4182]
MRRSTIGHSPPRHHPGMLPGLPAYLPNVIQSLTQDTGEPIPPAIFTSLLLCMVAGNGKHLMLRTTHEEDVEEIKALVVRVLVTIFGLPTQRIALRPDVNAVDFLNDVFLVAPATSTSSANLLQLSPAVTGPVSTSQKSRHGRMGSTATSTSGRRPPSDHGRRSGGKLERSESGSSFAITNSLTIPTGGHYPPREKGHGRTSSSTSNMTSATGNTVTQQSISRPRKKSTPVASNGGRHFHEPQDYRPQGVHVQPPRLPHALVLSRLEKAKPSVQDSLADVLRSGRVSPDDYALTDGLWDEDEEDEEAVSGGTWNLPAGFIVVYVCPVGDGTESAPIARSLLDRFSFSARITIEPDVYNTYPGPFKRQALISREEIERLQNLCTAVHIAPRLQNYMSSLLSATRSHPLLDPTLLTARCVADYADLVRASRVVLGRYERSIEASEPKGGSSPQVMSASDSDARKMLGSALEHRLNVRKRPEDEVMGSLYTTAVGEVTSENRKSIGRKGVEEEYSADDEREGNMRIEGRDDGTVLVEQTIQMILHSILEDV